MKKNVRSPRGGFFGLTLYMLHGMSSVRGTLVLSHVSPTYPVDDRCVMSVPIGRLVVPTSRLSTVGSRAFPIAGPQTWNDLPEDVTSAESLTTFRRLLKTHLLRKSFPDYLLDINWFSVNLAVVLLWGHIKIDWLTLRSVIKNGKMVNGSLIL